LNHRKKTKADGSRLIPRKHTETLVLLSVNYTSWLHASCVPRLIWNLHIIITENFTNTDIFCLVLPTAYPLKE